MSFKLNPGVITNQAVSEVFHWASDSGFALPAVNVVNLDSINALLEGAALAKSPIIIQFSHNGAAFLAGPSIVNIQSQQSIKGATLAAAYIHKMAKWYGASVMLHSDHTPKNALAWLDGLIKASRLNRAPLFSSHMLDLSQEPLQENIQLSQTYFKKLRDLGITLEVEIGILSGEEDGATSFMNASFTEGYSRPQDVAKMYDALKSIGNQFTIAPSFGNAHGLYANGTVKLKPSILKDCQNYLEHRDNLTQKNPIHFVFHGGSGSSEKELKEAIQYGVVKVNIDTQMQWAAWNGIHTYYQQNADRLQTPVGSNGHAERPNKVCYDPRKWIRASQLSMIAELHDICKTLGTFNLL